MTVFIYNGASSHEIHLIMSLFQIELARFKIQGTLMNRTLHVFLMTTLAKTLLTTRTSRLLKGAMTIKILLSGGFAG